MPAVTIDLLAGRTAEELGRIADAVHDAIVEALDVPERDRFQIVTEHESHAFHFNRSYLEIERSERFVLVRITLAAGRSTDVKRAFYGRLAELLAERVGLRREDLGVVLTENAREDWSFGNGQANYLELPRDRWR